MTGRMLKINPKVGMLSDGKKTTYDPSIDDKNPDKLLEFDPPVQK
jgi:hypothetical protein